MSRARRPGVIQKKMAFDADFLSLDFASKRARRTVAPLSRSAGGGRGDYGRPTAIAQLRHLAEWLNWVYRRGGSIRSLPIVRTAKDLEPWRPNLQRKVTTGSSLQRKNRLIASEICAAIWCESEASLSSERIFSLRLRAF